MKNIHPGEECVEKILRLRDAIRTSEYVPPIYLIIRLKDGMPLSFVLEDEGQIQVGKPCGKKECPLIKLLSKKGDLITIIDSHVPCSLKMSNDARGKSIFLSRLN